MAVTGVVHPDRVIRNIGVRPGDALVLTKALGTGIVTTALKQRRASPESVDAAIASMVTLNRAASEVMRQFPVHAASDVTGYGLLGHAFEMASGSGVTIELTAASLPTLPCARELAESGALTGGCHRNRTYLAGRVEIAPDLPRGLVEVAFDPQTSGGLLIAIAAAHSDALLRALSEHDVAAALVGHALPAGERAIRLR
jgi:selenide,water dikinase